MREQTHICQSAHLGNERTVWIRSKPETGQPRNLVIFLDGELYREHVGATTIADHLSRTGAIASTIFVFVSSESVASRWIECPCHPPFAQFICEELLPWLEAKYPAAKACDERVLVGLSYTGLAAAYVALQSPGVFTKVIAQSGSFWWNDCRLVERFAQLKTKLPTDFYLDVGLQETDVDVDHGEVQQTVSQVDAVQRLRDVLKNSGHSVKHVVFDGGHDPAKWQEALPGALKWALTAP